MATELFANNTSTTVSSGGTTAPASGTQETWTVASSASFPAVTTGAGTQFHVADPSSPVNSAEKIAVTNVSGTTWTVTRGAENTTPVVHAAGFTVVEVVTAGTLGTFAQTTALNTFTVTPQQIGTSFASGAAVIGGQMILGSNGAAPPTVAPPAIKLYGYCGGAAGNNGWDMGIDTANHGGGQDFYLGAYQNGVTTDLFYMNWPSGCLGLRSATPPTNSYALEILTKPSDTVGSLGLGVGSGATGNALTIYPSSGIPNIWVDSLMWVNTVAGGAGLLVRGEATNDLGICVANNAKTKLWTLSSLNSGSLFELKYNTGGISNFWGHTDGSVEFLHNVRVNAGFAFLHNLKAANYTLTTSDPPFLGCNTSGGAITITLPAPPSTSQFYIIKDENGAANTNNVTVSAGAKLIDGAASKVINTSFGVLRAYTDGTNWFTF